ncbi:MAG: IS630 transposase-related protein [Thermomicrobiales bacterium]
MVAIGVMFATVAVCSASSVDLCVRVMAAVSDGRSMAEVAQQFSVSVDAIADWKRLQATTAILAPVAHRPGRPRALSAADHQLLRARIAERPDATSREPRDWLATEHQVTASTSSVWRVLTRMGLTRKKEPDRDRTGCRPASRLAG